ncbi:MAG: ATP cone domain-containing protein [Clostridium paraputrificum]
MKIIKRDFRIQNFSIEKLENSILLPAKDLEMEVTEEDLTKIINSILSKLIKLRAHNDKTSVYELRGIVFECLLLNNFKKVAYRYFDIIC